ncbi:MAG: hypothetical protein V3W44_01445 [Dehalococcoidales bacterium]
MPRYIQCLKTNKLIPAEEYYAPKQAAHAVHGDIEPFVSPIDGTAISDRKQYNEHCKRHNVVPAAEFTPEFYARKAKERADMYEGRRSTRQVQRDRMEIHEIINKLERSR